MAFPYLFVYLDEVRGFAAYQSGLILAAGGVAVLVCNVLGGTLVDRIGTRPQLLLAAVIQGLGFVLYIAARGEPWPTPARL
jgi:predicted MFS family arabinose efflux permease